MQKTVSIAVSTGMMAAVVIGLATAGGVGAYVLLGGLPPGPSGLSIAVTSYSLENYTSALYAEEYLVNFTNSGGSSVSVDPANFKLVTASGQTIDSFVCFPSVFTNCSGYLRTTTIQPKSSTSGIVAFRAPKSESPKELDYAGGGLKLSTAVFPAPYYVSIVQRGYLTIKGDPGRCLSMTATLANDSGYFLTGEVIDLRFEVGNVCNRVYQIQGFSIAQQGFKVSGSSSPLPISVRANTYANFVDFHLYIVAPNYSYANPKADYVQGLDITAAVAPQ